MNKYIFQCDTILTNLYNFQPETFLYQSEFVVFTEYQRLSILYINGILRTALLRIDRIISTIIEYHTVLHDFTDGCTFMIIGCFQNVYCAGCIRSNGTGKEMSAGTETKFCRTERVFYSSIRR